MTTLQKSLKPKATQGLDLLFKIKGVLIGIIIKALSKHNNFTANPQAGMEDVASFAGRLMKILQNGIYRQGTGRHLGSSAGRSSQGQA